MKNLVSVILACFLLCAPAPAEAEITVSDKSIIQFPGEDYGYFFAKVENTGDVKTAAESGKLVIFSADDDILVSADYIGTYPSSVSIEPGDYLYINYYIWDSALKDAVLGDYKFSISEYERSADIAKLPCETKIILSEESLYENYVNVTFTNTLDEQLKKFYVTVALYDAGGNLVYVSGDMTYDIFVHPNSTITVSQSISSTFIEYFAENGIKIEKVDAMVCYEK